MPAFDPRLFAARRSFLVGALARLESPREFSSRLMTDLPKNSKSMSHRREKINELIRDEVGKILHRELDLNFEALVTVTRAVVSDDQNHVRVYVSVFPSNVAQEALQSINRNIYFFQQTLNK